MFSLSLTFTSRTFTRNLRCEHQQASRIRTAFLFGSSRISFAMGSIQQPRRTVGKKFVISCDGTWQNSDAGFEQDSIVPGSPVHAQIPTNVTRLTRALNKFDTVDGKVVEQVAYYQRGVGADGDLQDRLQSGLAGEDISEHIREAYAFVANNFQPETQAAVDDRTKPMDEIVILGFSRGAYTARAIADLISTIGLLTKIGMEQFWGIFTDWTSQDMGPALASEWFIKKFPDTSAKFLKEKGRVIAFVDKEYRQQLMDLSLTRWGMPIRAVGVFDTVGSLGIPISFGKKNVKPYSFVDTKVARGVEHAFHALAIDEHRGLFSPTLWEQPDGVQGKDYYLKLLKQTWFPGSHSGIGGGYDDCQQANISLAWMVSCLEDNGGGILSFDQNYLNWVQQNAADWYKTQNPPTIRPWGLGTIYNSSAVKSLIAGVEAIMPIARTPGEYHFVDNDTGKQMPNVPLKGTNERIHPCVRIRIDKHGKGLLGVDGATSKLGQLFNDAKAIFGGPLIELAAYQPPAMSKYTLVESGSAPAVWRWNDPEVAGKDLPEDTLGATEKRLMERWATLK